jgi:ADP-heptose:LPS heptosyltransferase
MKLRPKGILAIDAMPFGRSLALLPALKSIRTAFPDAVLQAATCTGTCELLAANGLCEQTIDLGVIKPMPKPIAAMSRRLVRLHRRVRRGRIDLVLDFAPLIETQVFSRLVVRSRVITPAGLPGGLDALLGRRESTVDWFGRYRDVLRQAGVRDQDEQLALRPSEQENARFEGLLSSKGPGSGQPLIIVYAADAENPNSGWAPDHLASLTSRLSTNYGARTVAIDVPGDRAFTDKLNLLLAQGSVMLTAPDASLLVAAIARGSLVLTDDLGIARLAASLDTPVLELGGEGSVPNNPACHAVITGTCRSAGEAAYKAACEMLQRSRTESLFTRQ